MAIRFYLDNRPNKVGEHPIRVSVCVKGTKLISTIGHSVTPEVWADGTVAKAKYTNSKGITGKQINAEIMKLQACFAEYELKGVPVRVTLGARDLENGMVEIMRRDKLEKSSVAYEGVAQYIKDLLADIQSNIFQKALDYRASVTREVNSYDEFKVEIEKGGFISAHWDGTPETEELIKQETKATIRCIPLDGDATPGVCMVTGKPSARRVLFARAY